MMNGLHSVIESLVGVKKVLLDQVKGRIAERKNLRLQNERQSKKRREVFLPIEKNLLDMLQKQHNDFGFQKYVAPRPKPIKDEYRPYNLQSISKIGNCVI